MPALTVTDAATLAKRSPQLIRRALRSGAIKGRAITPRFWIVDEASLREWMAKPKKAGRPEKQK